MFTTGTPDLLTAGRLSRGVADVTRDLSRVAEELTSGLQTDLVEASGGDPARLYAIEREISENETQGQSIILAKGRSAVTQSALERVQTAAEAIGVPAAAAAGKGDIRGADLIGVEARSAFATAISALNARFGDRSLFSGAATNSPAVADADVILSDILARAGGAIDAAEFIAAVDDYFSDPAGFAETGYLGSDLDASQVEIYDGERLSFAVRADDEAIIATLSALATAAIVSDTGLGDDARLNVYQEAGSRGVAATAEVVALRAGLGVAEDRLEEADARNEAGRLVLEQRLSTLRARDPFEAATEFSALETQLQTMFSVTARLSSLSLTNFLR